MALNNTFCQSPQKAQFSLKFSYLWSIVTPEVLGLLVVGMCDHLTVHGMPIIYVSIKRVKASEVKCLAIYLVTIICHFKVCRPILCYDTSHLKGKALDIYSKTCHIRRWPYVDHQSMDKSYTWKSASAVDTYRYTLPLSVECIHSGTLTFTVTLFLDLD